MVPIVIPGFTTSDRVPGAVTLTVYGNGLQSIGSAPLLCAVMGNLLVGGTATPDSSVIPIYSTNDADTSFGAGAEISTMCYAALANENIALFGIPVAIPSGTPVAASLVMTITGTWTTGGTVAIRLGGIALQINVGAGDTVTQVAAAIASAINNVPRIPFVGTAALGVATATVLNKGVRGNDYVGAVDLSKAPAGLIFTFTGGSVLTGGITPFSGGTGADNVVAALAILATKTWDFQAWAQRDSTNAGLINAQLTQQAGALVAHPGFAVFAQGRSTSASITFSQTVLNQQLACVVHHTNTETPPHVMAAFVAGLFSTTAGANPNMRYVGAECPPIAPQSQSADIPTRATLNALLNAGVTPLTTKNGKVVIVDAICSHSLNGSSQDLRTYHVGDVFTPIRIQKELAALWDVTAAVNPYAGPDPSPGQNPLPVGNISPQRWLAIVNKALLDYQDRNWLQDVENHPAVAAWDPEAKRIMTAVPEIVRSQNIQMGLIGNQTAAS
jgi:phage tail sheath gpL-like